MLGDRHGNVNNLLGTFSGDGGAAQDDSIKASLDLVHTDLDALIVAHTAIEMCVEKSDGTIKISDAKMEIREMLKVFPLWFNKDEDGLIRKGSTLALFLQSAGVSNVVGLIGKTMTTTEDSNGYLVFKAY